MRGFFTVVIALVALLGSGETERTEDFWRKTNANHLMMRCLTPEGEVAWVDQMDRAMGFCNQNAAELPPVELPANIDWNRVTNSELHFTPEKIETLTQKLKRRVQVFRCVMQRTRITDSTYEVNPEILIPQYRALNLSDTLQEDIAQAVYQCNNFTQCMPVGTGSEVALPADVIRTKTFLKCEMFLRYVGCVKEGVKRYMHGFDLSGLDGTMEFLDEDRAKATLILIGNDKLGYPDYGLFE